jgi:hypothetical protein
MTLTASCSHVHGNNTCTCIKSTKPEGYLIDKQVMHLGYIFITSRKERSNNIFHKNREISILTIKKKTARLTLLQEATERTSQGETQNKTKHEKHTAVHPWSSGDDVHYKNQGIVLCLLTELRHSKS